jgi:hypothetical protein
MRIAHSALDQVRSYAIERGCTEFDEAGRRTGAYTDIRNDIAAIKANVAWIVHHLGIGKEET